MSKEGFNYSYWAKEAEEAKKRKDVAKESYATYRMGDGQRERELQKLRKQQEDLQPDAKYWEKLASEYKPQDNISTGLTKSYYEYKAEEAKKKR